MDTHRADVRLMGVQRDYKQAYYIFSKIIKNTPRIFLTASKNTISIEITHLLLRLYLLGSWGVYKGAIAAIGVEKKNNPEKNILIRMFFF